MFEDVAVPDVTACVSIKAERKRELKFTGPPIPPDPNEMGWKDAVRAEPGMRTEFTLT